MLNLSSILTIIRNQALGRPVEIYDIYLGSQTAEDSNTLYFVNFYKTINFFTYLGHLPQPYLPLGINRSAVKRSSQGEIDRITYELCNVNKAMGAYAAEHDFRNRRIVTRLIFRDHLDSYLDAKIIFDGFIQAIAFEQNKMTATCTPKIGSLSFEPGWPYQIQCNAKFGDSFCKINKSDVANNKSGIATGGTISTLIDTNNLTQTNDYWNWGTVTFTSGNNTGISRKIIDFVNATNTATFDYALDTAVVAGDEYIIYRGCDKTLAMCQSPYENDSNYHGFHTIPLSQT